jgi:shikimate dehydrogenase
MRFSPTTKLTAVIGNPVAHSLSPCIHNAIYAEENIDAVLLAFGHPSVQDLVGAIRTLPIHWAAVTMPHKQTIMPLLDSIDPIAQKIGAVNTVINRDGKLEGFNTDVTGVAASLKEVPLKGKNVLLIGAGGVAQPIAYHLESEGAKMYCMNRVLADAQKLCDKFGGSPIESANLKDVAFDVIINATPVGMEPNVDATPVAKEHIRKGAVIFDVIYAPLETKLMREAKERGASVISGLTMFIEQALQQERLWLSRDIKNNGYTKHVMEELAKRKH